MKVSEIEMNIQVWEIICLISLLKPASGTHNFLLISKHKSNGGTKKSNSKLLLRAGGSNSRQAWPVTLEKYDSSKNEPSYYPTVETVPPERKTIDIDAFLTRDNRNSFITRVYAILTVQLIFTCASILGFSTNRDISLWMLNKGRIVTFLSLGISSLAMIIMSVSEKARRESPLKWQLLALFTLGEAISVGVISSLYPFRAVLSAMIATAAATGSITMYTLIQQNPKYDLSQWGASLYSCAMIFLVYGVIHLLEMYGILPRGFLPYSEAIYSIIGASLFSLFLARHTRMIISGKHTKYQLNEKDYVYGAMTLYNDIINIFIYLLRLLGEDKDNR